MVALLRYANSAISLLIRTEQKHLATRVLKRVFEPALADRLGSNEAPKRNLLCNEHPSIGPILCAKMKML